MIETPIMSDAMNPAQDYEKVSSSYKARSGEIDLNWEQKIGWQAKLEGVEHLLTPEGANYDSENGYGYLESVDRAVSMAKEAFGHENQIRESVIEVRNYLMDLGRMEHASQLDETLVSPGVGRGKLSCREVKGGNGRHPGDPEGKKQGPSGGWREGNYEDHTSFEISETDQNLLEYIL